MKKSSLKILDKISRKYALVKYNEEFANYSSLKASFFVFCIIEPKTINKLKKIIKLFYKNNIKFNFFTYGTNSYVTNPNLILINLKNLKLINKIRHKSICVSGNQRMSYLSSYYKKEGIDSFLGGTMIPGSIGAGIKINASIGELSINKYLKKIYVITEKGKKKCLKAKNIEMKYRNTSIKESNIIYKAIFKKHYSYNTIDEYLYLLDKRKNQPKGNSLGSVFLNTDSYKAWQLIDSCNLKGFSYKGFRISNIHSNFIINEGNGSTLDFDRLIFIIKLIVLLKTNIKIKEEVIRLN